MNPYINLSDNIISNNRISATPKAQKDKLEGSTNDLVTLWGLYFYNIPLTTTYQTGTHHKPKQTYRPFFFFFFKRNDLQTHYLTNRTH